jgi:hypothetical protein
MGEVINLRLRRKDRKRGEKDKAAAEKRNVFGESKNLKSLRKKEKAQLDKAVEGAKRDKPETNA